MFQVVENEKNFFNFSGSLNDAGIFGDSELGQHLEEGGIDWPPGKVLPGSDVELPYWIVGDGGFPIKSYLMRPYAKSQNYGQREKIFNYRLSRARRIIECAFGTLQKKWKIFETRMSFKLQNTETVVLALLALHNFLITEDPNRYLQDNDPNFDDVRDFEERENGDNEEEENEHQEVEDDDFHLGNGINNRNQLADYFLTPNGQVHWQWRLRNL